MRKGLLVLVAAMLALAVTAGVAPAQSTGSQYARAYVDELWISQTIEARGAYYKSRKLAVDSALCSGLRRYGVRTSAYGLDKFWRFKCNLFGADEHSYTAHVSTTTGPKRGYIYWHFLSVRRDF